MSQQTHHDNAQPPPWDVMPSRFKRRMGKVLRVLNGCFLAYMVTLILVVNFDIIRWQLGWECAGFPFEHLIGGMAAFLVLLVIVFTLIHTCAVALGVTAGGDVQHKCGDSPIYLVSVARFRGFRGRGAIGFGEEQMWIEGSLGINTLAPAVAILLAGFVAANFWEGALILPAVSVFVVTLITCERLIRKRHRIDVEVGILEHVECRGPIIELRFDTPPVPMLTAVRIYVCQDFRREFFRRFEDALPGILPEEYRAALEGEGKSESEGAP